MDDPAWAWPAWKFGMKRDDLHTTLHDQYNTFSYSIQDPEAFHHDVFEISRKADTAEQFHRFMADRQRQRLIELNESLESLAVEIIANPKLIGTDQWQHALQLFRTKSFDSIVRYFASYLPEDYLDRHHGDWCYSSASSYSEADSIYTTSTKASSANDASSPFFDDDFFPHGPVMTAEPCPLESEGLPMSPESEAAQPDSPAYTTTNSTNPPSRSMSFSGSDSGRLEESGLIRSLIHDDDETSQSDECDTTVTSVCDSAETRSSYDPADDLDVKDLPVHIVDGEDADDDDIPTTQCPEDDFCFLDSSDATDSPNCNTYDTLESDTPTPRQVTESTSYLDFKPILSSQRTPSLPKSHIYPRASSPRSCFARSRAEGSSVLDIRRSPEEALNKIQKPSTDSLRKRPKAWRRMD